MQPAKSTKQVVAKVRQNCVQTKLASRQLLKLTTRQKNDLLRAMSKALHHNQQRILVANQIDLDAARQAGLSEAMQDRLRLKETDIEQMQIALASLINLADPLAVDYPVEVQPSGIQVTRKQIPIGVILMIYESRPNVTVEAAALALKSGNAIILRGGKEALASNMAIANCWQKALEENQLNPKAVHLITNKRHELLNHLLKFDDLIDLVIPRGGEGLIKAVVKHSYIPVIKHYKGVCHLFVDASADFIKALEILVNGKTQRPGVCNALECLLVHRQIAADFLPSAIQALEQEGVVIYGCEASREISPDIAPASASDFGNEFLSLKMALKVVDDIDDAIAFIERYGSHHTEVIATQSDRNANLFISQVDASVVMVNASSRFSDGGELGLGAEIGISTTKLHAYGPMGLSSLTTSKFIVVGEGQVRR